MQEPEPKNSTELESRIHRKGVRPVRWGGDRNLIWKQMKALAPYPTQQAASASNLPTRPSGAGCRSPCKRSPTRLARAQGVGIGARAR